MASGFRTMLCTMWSTAPRMRSGWGSLFFASSRETSSRSSCVVRKPRPRRASPLRHWIGRCRSFGAESGAARVAVRSPRAPDPQTVRDPAEGSGASPLAQRAPFAPWRKSSVFAPPAPPALPARQAQWQLAAATKPCPRRKRSGPRRVPERSRQIPPSPTPRGMSRSGPCPDPPLRRTAAWASRGTASARISPDLRKRSCSTPAVRRSAADSIRGTPAGRRACPATVGRVPRRTYPA